MYSVDVRLPHNYLATLMCDMRSWRDLHSVSVSKFSYTEGIDQLVAYLKIGAKQEANAFTIRLAGSMISEQSSVGALRRRRMSCRTIPSRSPKVGDTSAHVSQLYDVTGAPRGIDVGAERAPKPTSPLCAVSVGLR
jgi:hypothetical protein